MNVTIPWNDTCLNLKTMSIYAKIGVATRSHARNNSRCDGRGGAMELAENDQQATTHDRMTAFPTSLLYASTNMNINLTSQK